MKVVIIVGSQRRASQSGKVGGAIETRLREMQACQDCQLVELAVTRLPFWDDDLADGDRQRIAELGAALTEANAFVFVTPEWHGMVPAALKNFFLHFSGGELAHKPALIVAVSAGNGGAYPVTELRSSSYKNSRVCYLPEHLIVRRVESVFNTEQANDPASQSYLEQRLTYCLELLLCYAEGMQLIRFRLPDASPFPSGM
jgi:NAD(P)H-dependent FMN reductase